MTHDELLESINSFIEFYDDGNECGCSSCRAFKALRAVVELHKPVMAFTGGYDGLNNELWAEQCNDCSSNGFSQEYSCPTIQAIEKALI